MRILLTGLLLALSTPSPAAGFKPRDRGYRAQHYRLELDLDAKTGAFKARTTITLQPSRALRLVELDLARQRATAASTAGAELEISRGRSGLVAEDDLLLLKPPSPLPAGRPVELVIESEGEAGTDQEGFYKVVDPSRPGAPPLYATQMEPVGARRLFPCDDQPGDKATTEVLVTTDEAYRVWSNGKLIKDEPVGQGRHRVHWSQEKPHSTYLVAVVVAQFESVRGQVHAVPLAVHSAPGTGAQARFSLQAMEKVIPFFEEWLDVPYPWARLDIAALPLFLYGGMENTTLIVDNDRTVGTLDLATPGVELAPFGLVAHETAHQWFGDLVTMRWWEDVWLNESMATLLGGLAQERLVDAGESAARVSGLMLRYFEQEDGPRSHPIMGPVLSHPQDAFDSTNYVKGGAVLRTLMAWMGEPAFRRGLHGYLTAHSYGNATSKDLIDALGRAAGQDLTAFRKAWLEQRGYPVLKARWAWSGEKNEVTLQLSQRANHSGEATLFPLRLPVALRRRAPPAYDVEVMVPLTGRTAALAVPLPAPPDWVSWNAGAQVLARMEVQSSEDEHVKVATLDPDPGTRIAELLRISWPLLDRDRRTPPQLSHEDALALAKAISADPSPLVRAQLLEALTRARFPLPGELEAPSLELAKAHARPDGRAWFEARNGAWGVLGMLGSESGHALYKAPALDAGTDRGTLLAATEALAFAKDVASLDEALKAQEARGYAYKRVVLAAYSRVPDPAVVQRLQALLSEASGNDELLQLLFRGLADNAVVARSEEGAKYVARIVLDQELKMSEEVRARALQMLADFKTKASLAQLQRIAKAKLTPRLTGNASKLAGRLAKQLVRMPAPSDASARPAG